MPVLSSGSLKIDYNDDGQGQPVVLIHSSVSANRQWRPLTELLKDRYRVLALNLFGYGEIGEEGSSSYRRSSGALLSIFGDRLKNKDRFAGVRIDDKEDVYPALKQFFGKRGVETPA